MKCSKCDGVIPSSDIYGTENAICEVCYQIMGEIGKQLKSDRIITDDELYYKFGFEL